MATLSREFIEQDKSPPHDGPEETLNRLRLYFQRFDLPEQRTAAIADGQHDEDTPG